MKYDIVVSATGAILESVDAEWEQVKQRIAKLNAKALGVMARKTPAYQGTIWPVKGQPVDGLLFAVDCWTSGNPGLGGAKIVMYDETSGKWKVIEEWTSEKPHTNNYFELVAIGLGLKHAIESKYQGQIRIYSDSRTALGWVDSGVHKATADVDVISLMIRKINTMLVEHSNIFLEKWATERLGEIPADSGRK